MSTLETKKIEPLSGTTVTLGAAGDAVTMPAGVTVKTNTVKDAGGNTLWTSDGSGTLSSVNSALQGNMIFISSQTASDSSSIDITSGIDSTYDEYMFVLTDINPETNSANFEFQVNAAGASGYNETMTTTYVEAYHAEADNSNGVVYKTSGDQAQGTAYQRLARATGNGADECSAGILHLFSPSNTTYVTHFYSRLSVHKNEPCVLDCYVAGYINITAAVDEISFKMSTGNLDGTIALYGIK